MSMTESTTRSTVTLGDVQFDPVDTQDFRLSVEGTSGTGKSNTLAVILEDLADVAIPTLIIERLGALSPVRLEDDAIVVVGARQEEGVDLAVGLEDLDQIGTWVLDRGMKILLDVSTYADYEQEGSRVHEAAARAVRSLNDWAHEKYRAGDRTKSLLAVDEAHYMAPKDSAPEPELNEHVKRCRGQLIKVATEGGNKGISVIVGYQRRAFLHNGVIQLAQDFIAHRPGDEDISRTSRALRCSEDELASLGTGEILARGASVTGGELIGPTTVRKRRSPDPREDSFDLPETPDELSEVLEAIQDEVEAERERRDQRQDKLERLQEENEKLREQKAKLEEELSDTSRIADALQNLGGISSTQSEAAQDVGEGVERLQEQVAQLKDDKADLQETIAELEDDIADAEERNADLEARLAEAQADVEHLCETLGEARSALGVEVGSEATGEASSEAHRELNELRAELEQREEKIEELQAKVDGGTGNELGDLVSHEAVQAAVGVAKDNSDRADEHFDRVLAVLTSSDGGPLAGDEIAPLTETSESNVKTVLRDLFDAGVVRREKDGRSYEYELDRQFLERRIEVSEQQLSA